MKKRSLQRMTETIPNKVASRMNDSVESLSTLSQYQIMQPASKSQIKGKLLLIPNNRRSKTPHSFHNPQVSEAAKERKKPNSHVCENKTSLCFTQTYKRGLCKVHFLEHLQSTLRKTVHRVYKDPESAFAAFNFTGLANISMNDILEHRVVKSLGYDMDDIKSYLLRDNIFATESSEIGFTQFKKFFFPQLMLIEEGAERELVRQEDTVLDKFN